MPPTATTTRTGGPGTVPAPPRVPTRTWPPTWSALRGAHRLAGGRGGGRVLASAPSELTADPARRSERAVTAAEASFQAGAFDATLQLTTTAEAGSLDEFQRARLNLLRGHIALVLGYGDDAAPLLLEAARQLEPFDLDLAREAYLTAYGSAFVRFVSRTTRPSSSRSAEPSKSSPRRGEPRMRSTLLLEGMARTHTDGRAAAMPIVQARGDGRRADAPRRCPPLGVDGALRRSCDMGRCWLERDLRAAATHRSRRRCACGAAGLRCRRWLWTRRGTEIWPAPPCSSRRPTPWPRRPAASSLLWRACGWQRSVAGKPRLLR